MVRRIKAKRVLALHAQGLSGRAIARALGASRDSVAMTLRAAADAGVSYGDVADSDDGEVYALLFPGRNEHPSAYRQPDWTVVHRELARTGVTSDAAARRVPGFVHGRRRAVDGLRPVPRSRVFLFNCLLRF